MRVEDIVVIPSKVEKNSVKVIGNSESFNVSWNPVDNVNYGTVFYEVQIDNLYRNNSTVSIKYQRRRNLILRTTPLLYISSRLSLLTHQSNTGRK